MQSKAQNLDQLLFSDSLSIGRPVLADRRFLLGPLSLPDRFGLLQRLSDLF